MIVAVLGPPVVPHPIIVVTHLLYILSSMMSQLPLSPLSLGELLGAPVADDLVHVLVDIVVVLAPHNVVLAV